MRGQGNKFNHVLSIWLKCRVSDDSQGCLLLGYTKSHDYNRWCWKTYNVKNGVQLHYTPGHYTILVIKNSLFEVFNNQYGVLLHGCNVAPSVISLMDAMFCHCFYKCSYNTGYCVVAEFIVQSEPSDCIKEALQILKTWNPNWHPKFFHDQLFWGRNWSFEGIFPGTTVYFCNCHREQAWERRVCDKKQSLSSEDAESLLDQLRPCAWAPV